MQPGGPATTQALAVIPPGAHRPVWLPARLMTHKGD